MLTLKENLSFDQAKIITESDQEGKNLFMQGIFVQGDKRNQNSRVYPVTEISRAVKAIQEKIETGYSVLGEADHPDDLQVNLDRVSHMIEKMWMDGQDGYGRLKLLPTPMGNICKTLLENGVKLGVSSRGLGTLKENRDGVQVVQDDFHLATAADIVADPSAPDAFVRGIMENKEWVVVNGVWTEQHCDMSKKYIKKASKKQLEEAKIQVFERFLRHLSSK